MRWTNELKGEIAADWQKNNYLDHTDAYLVWLDITRSRGTSKIGIKGLLPVMIEFKDGHPKFKSRALNAAEVARLADPAQRANIERFEVAAGFVSEEGDERSADGLDVGPSDRQARREGGKPVVGFIDYGCAFAHRQFRDGNGTRVKAIWNQETRLPVLPPNSNHKSLHWRLPTGYWYGKETLRGNAGQKGNECDLNGYIAQFQRPGGLDEHALYRHCTYPAIAERHATHGTHVMDLATGFPSPLQTIPALKAHQPSVPHKADIVFVQLPQVVGGRQISGLLRANVYDAVRYIIDCTPANQPAVINLSYGTNAGPHDGTSILEMALDSLLKESGNERITLVLPAGNARDSKLHAKATVSEGKAVFCWNNLPDDPSDSFVEFWFPDGADVSLKVTTPTGAKSHSVVPGHGVSLQDSAGYVIGALIFPVKPCQSATGRMALLATARTRPGDGAVRAPYGAWKIEVSTEAAGSIDVHAWCERDHVAFGNEGTPRQSYFSDTPSTKCDTDHTLNSIAHGNAPWVVGGYALGGDVAVYSGTGPGRNMPGRDRNDAKRRGPDVLAPSDESPVVAGLSGAAVIGTDTIRLNGTSVSAAVLTRRIIEAGFVAPPVKLGPPKKHPIAPPNGRRPHPDRDLERL